MKNKLSIVFATLALLFTVQVSSQAQYNRKDLIGKWKISLEHVIESLPAAQKEAYDKLSDKEKQSTILMLQQMVGNLRWEFMQDGNTKVSLGDGKEQNGTWKMNGNIITLNTDGQNKTMTILKLNSTLFRFSSVDDTGNKIIMTLEPVN
ncbi:hypothetical protein BKI52_34325 [marine bacterium AO1-C]|nr:hypothetical protein BKI52_34325 [marine bacterium AO1-C]